MLIQWARIVQSVYRLVTVWKVWGSNTGGGEISCTRPKRPWDPPSLLYSGCRVSFPGRGVVHPTSSSAEVEERIQQYLFSPCGFSWPVTG